MCVIQAGLLVIGFKLEKAADVRVQQTFKVVRHRATEKQGVLNEKLSCMKVTFRYRFSHRLVAQCE